MIAKNKEDFLSQLKNELNRIGVDAGEDIFSDFEEHFMASAKEGLSEEETCQRLGDVKEIARNYINIESSRINSIVAQAIEADRPHVSLTKPGRDVPADLSLLDREKKGEEKPIREYTPEHFSEEIYPNARQAGAPHFAPEHGNDEQSVPPKAEEAAAQPDGTSNGSTEGSESHSGQNGQNGQDGQPNQPLADALGAAGSAVAEAAKVAGKAVASAFNTDTVKNAGKNAADAMKNAGHAFADAMKTSAENFRNEARKNERDFRDAAREARQEARDAAREARQEAREAAREARHEFRTGSGRAYHDNGQKVYEFYGGEDVMPGGPGGVPQPSDSFRGANSSSRVGEVPPQSCPPVGSGKASKFSDLKGRKMNPSFGKLFGCILLDVFIWSWLLCLLASIAIGFGSVCLGLVGSGISSFCGAFDYNVISSIFLGLGQISLGGIFAGFALLMVKAVIALVRSIIWQHVKALYDI